MDSHGSELRVEAYVRSAQLLAPIDAKIDTLRTLESDGLLSDLTVYAWPEKVALSERTPYSDALEAFERMEAWADEHGASIRPPFAVRTTTSSITGERRTTLRTPVMCLLVYADDRLANVFPHSLDGEHYSVTDAIAFLRTGQLDVLTATRTTSHRPPDRCPSCDRWLTNVQGIGVCHDCDRIEIGTKRAGDRGRRLPVRN